jgi:succinyl-CoA synthetase alpha subunit
VSLCVFRAPLQFLNAGTLTYEAADQVVKQLGITTATGGGDPIIGTTTKKLSIVWNDPETECICNDR